MSHLTLRERQRQLREDAILESAHELIVAQGFVEMSMEELAARVGISKATLYQHFPSKEDLGVNVLLRFMRQGEERIRAMDPALPAITRLEQMLRQGFERRAELWFTGLSHMPHSVTCHTQFQAQHQRMMELVTGLVDEAKADGDIAPARSSPVVARMLLRLFRPDYEDLVVSGCCTLDEIINTLVAVVFDGLRSRAKA